MPSLRATPVPSAAEGPITPRRGGPRPGPEHGPTLVHIGELTPPTPRRAAVPALGPGSPGHCEPRSEARRRPEPPPAAVAGGGAAKRRVASPEPPLGGVSPPSGAGQRGGRAGPPPWNAAALAVADGDERRGASPTSPGAPRGAARGASRLEDLLESHLALLSGPWLERRLQAAHDENARRLEAVIEEHTATILRECSTQRPEAPSMVMEDLWTRRSDGSLDSPPEPAPADPAGTEEAAVAKLEDGAFDGRRGTPSADDREYDTQRSTLSDHRRMLPTASSGSYLCTSNFMEWRSSDKPVVPTRTQATRLRRPWLWRLVGGFRALQDRLQALQLKADSLEQREPEGHDRCTRFFFRYLQRPFDTIGLVIILLNMCFVVETTNMEVIYPGEGTNEVVYIVDWCFTGFYVVELAVRLYTQRDHFFFGRNRYWHALDTILVIAAILADSGIGGSTLRTLRAARVVRSAKFIRLIYQVLKAEALEVMVNCLAGSVSMLFWCVMMICFFTFLFSVFFVQAIAEHLDSAEKSGIAVDQAVLENFQEWFPTVQRGMVSLFMVTTGGTDWTDVWKSVAPAGWFASAMFIYYILLFSIAVWNVVTSTFVDKALRLAKASDDTVVTEVGLQARRDARELRAIFARMDTDCNGKIDYDEFATCMKRPEFERWLQTRGLDIKETRTFFRMLSRNQPTVDIDTIVHVCMKMRGQATSIDLHTMRYELRKIQQTILKHGAGLAPEEASGHSGVPDSGDQLGLGWASGARA